MNPGQDSYINPLSKVPNHGINENPIAFALINSEETISDENNPITYGYSSQMIFIEEKLLPYAGGSYETASSVAGGEGQPPPHPVTIPRMLGNGPSLLDLRLPSNVLEYILELLRTNSGPGSVLNEKVAQSEKDEKEAKDFDIFNPHHDHHDHHDKNDDDYDYNLN
ncbi:predicted protein [Naegleria gruberi]|uniref:Predicted protein n=1 Tax=Naegleria gruberi TaxID=5762 RepID=D2W5M6_NAEGR|nr:uncharacterized protein NAEGRDRAFT_76717 [Naegleria gruberi]EFC35625.1 predicted protein [Naegleria gruberi]|eukprot:XP_002668369.1 predicted protein [Naegleria gruberi strain NEG-M]